MKLFILPMMLFLAFVIVPAVPASQQDLTTVETALKNSDAKQAIAIANELKWTHPKIRSYVTSRETVIEFPSGKVMKFPLPQDSMYIAVAPYVYRTHK